MSNLRLWGYTQVSRQNQPFQLDIVQRAIKRQMDKLFDTLMKDMASTQTEINDLIQKVSEINQAMDIFNNVSVTDTTEIENKLTVLESKLADVNNSLETCNEELEKIKTNETLLVDIKTRLDNIDNSQQLNNFGMVDAALTVLKERMTSAEDNIKTNVSGDKAVREVVKSHTDDLSDIKKSIEESKQHIDTFHDILQTNSLTTLKDQVDALDEYAEVWNELPDKISRLESFKEDITQKVTNVRKSLTEATNKIRAISDGQTEGETNLRSLQSFQSAVDQTVSNIQGDVQAMSGAVADCRLALEKLRDDAGNVISSKSLQSALIEVKSRIESVSENCSTRESALLGNIGRNERNIATLQEIGNRLQQKVENMEPTNVEEISDKLEELENDLEQIEDRFQQIGEITDRFDHHILQIGNRLQQQETKVNDLTDSLNQEKNLIKSVQKDCDLNTVSTSNNKEAIETINNTLNATSILSERVRHIPVVIQLSSWGDVVKNQPIFFQNGEDHYLFHVEGTLKKIVTYAQHPVICMLDNRSVTMTGPSQRTALMTHNIPINLYSMIRFNATENMDNFYVELYIYPRIPRN